MSHVGAIACIGRWKNLKNLVFLCLFVMLEASCATSHSQLSPLERARLYDDFTKGKATLDCFAACSYAWGYNRQSLKALYSSGQWRVLAEKVIEIGVNFDLSWYYLGRSAHALGHDDAARSYLQTSIKLSSTWQNCKTPLIDHCDGISLPSAAQALLSESVVRRAGKASEAVTDTINSSVEVVAADAIVSTLTESDKSELRQALRTGDYQRFVAKLEPLADAGDRIAQFLLGLLGRHEQLKLSIRTDKAFHYMSSVATKPFGTPKDEVWQARNMGWTAEYVLADMLIEGRGTNKDETSALFWSGVSAGQGSRSGRTISDKLRARLSVSEVKIAQARVDQFAQEHFAGAILIDGRPVEDYDISCEKINAHTTEILEFKKVVRTKDDTQKFRDLAASRILPSVTLIYPSATVAVDDIDYRLASIRAISNSKKCSQS